MEKRSAGIVGVLLDTYSFEVSEGVAVFWALVHILSLFYLLSQPFVFVGIDSTIS
jgi:hypothetical protein